MTREEFEALLYRVEGDGAMKARTAILDEFDRMHRAIRELGTSRDALYKELTEIRGALKVLLAHA